ncbi:MAG: protein adenylyltransferase SelO [Methylophilaceae bacterium]
MTSPVSFGFNFSNSYLTLPKDFYTQQTIKLFRAPQNIIFNQELAQALELNISELEQEGFIIANGDKLPQNAQPISQAYCGHQFGHFVKLGDGRAVLLGEHVTSQMSRFDIQLKGSGPTLYARGGDGLAAMGPMLREYLISEAMYHLGIPTTRSLGVMSTGDPVFRETTLPGAMLIRVAKSHIRVGTFEYAATLEKSLLQNFSDYVIERHFPELINEQNRYEKLLQVVINNQARLIAQWMCVGFIHGVMNTDNMSIPGESIDYGPCAFMNHYHPTTVFSSIDRHGRYAYQNQPIIGQWNLTRFAETLLPLFNDDIEVAKEKALELLGTFKHVYTQHWLQIMRHKIGIKTQSDDDLELIEDLLKMMETHQADFTLTFRHLNQPELLDPGMASSEAFRQWVLKRNQRIPEHQQQHSQQLMDAANPLVIPRNHLVEESLEQATQGNMKPFHDLLEVIKNPFSPPKDSFYLEPSSIEFEQTFKTFCGT